MKPRRHAVSYQRDEGFRLIIEEYSPFRTMTANALDKILCWGQRFDWQFDLCQALSRWEYNSVKDIASIPIGRATADAISVSPWTWLDDKA